MLPRVLHHTTEPRVTPAFAATEAAVRDACSIAFLLAIVDHEVLNCPTECQTARPQFLNECDSRDCKNGRWLHYEVLLEATIEALRGTNPDVR